MSKPRLFYFDFPSSRGEECRIALHLAGIEFDDVRIAGADWPAQKAHAPFGALPYLELPGKAPIADSNAILVYIGRQSGLHPADNYEAAFHEALMSYVEDLRHHVGPILRIKDEAQKLSEREELGRNFLPVWGQNVEKLLGDGPFVAGDKIHVLDLKLYMIVRWFVSGMLDHVPTTVFDACPKLKRIHQSVSEHPGVKAWVERK
ncbi:glutathione S-transferase [Oxalobacteraceae bacterium GrIS 2.11]